MPGPESDDWGAKLTVVERVADAFSSGDVDRIPSDVNGLVVERARWVGSGREFARSQAAA